MNLKCRQSDLFRASTLSGWYPEKARGGGDLSLGETIEVSHLDGVIDERPHDDSSMTGLLFKHNWSTPCLEDSVPRPVLSLQKSPLESYLLQHYVERSSSVLVNVDGPANSLRNIVLPRAGVSSMLMNAIYAVSSRHASNSDSNAEFRVGALTYYGRATTALQDSLTAFHAETTIAEREIVLLTSVILCKYEIVAGGYKNWRSHLRGLYKMLCTFEEKGAKISSEVVSYVQSL